MNEEVINWILIIIGIMTLLTTFYIANLFWLKNKLGEVISAKHNLINNFEDKLDKKSFEIINSKKSIAENINLYSINKEEQSWVYYSSLIETDDNLKQIYITLINIYKQKIMCLNFFQKNRVKKDILNIHLLRNNLSSLNRDFREGVLDLNKALSNIQIFYDVLYENIEIKLNKKDKNILKNIVIEYKYSKKYEIIELPYFGHGIKKNDS